MSKTKDFAEVIRRKLAADADLAAAVEQERFNANIAAEIWAVRTEAGLTQQEMADRTGTHQSVIARLENADYDGHSLKMLDRIAEAVGKRLNIQFVDKSFSLQPQSPISDVGQPTWDRSDHWAPTIKFKPKRATA